MDALFRRRQMMLAGGTPPAPLPYTPVEYIETDGTAYIDTGLKGNIPKSFEMRITPVAFGSDYFAIGSRPSSSLRMIPVAIYSTKKVGYTYNSGAYNPIDIAASINNNTPMDVRTHFRKGSQQINVKQYGASTYTTYSTSLNTDCTTAVNLFLFCVNMGGGSHSTIAQGLRLHSVKIYVDSTYTSLAFDGQPCIYNGEYGLWDRISNTFFGNAAGSGAFTGPSI